MSEGQEKLPEEVSEEQPERTSRKAVAAFLLSVGTVICVILVWATFNSSFFALMFVVLLLVTFVLALMASVEIRKSDRSVTGRSFVRWSIAINIVAVLGYIAYPNFLEPSVRSPVSRVRSDQRSLATAIEAYYVDHNVYPAWSIGPGNEDVCQTYNYMIAQSRRDMTAPAGLPSFAMNDATKPDYSYMTLTTPMSYITTYPNDPFAPLKYTTFVYWSVHPGGPHPSGKDVDGVGWIMVSPGPDRIYDIPVDYNAYDPATTQPSERLLAGTNRFGRAFTYDPTNGAVSTGDIWRVRQER